MTRQILLLILHNVLVSTNPVSLMSAQTYPIYQQNGYANPSINQPIDITSYLQGMTVQNQLPQLNLSPSSIRQILLNRILSSPSVQTTLNPNVLGYGSNLVEFSNNQIPPNLPNNYYAVPTEYLINGTTPARSEDNIADNKTKKKHKQNRRRSSKPRRKHDSSEKNNSNTNKNISVHDTSSQNNNNTGDTIKKTKKRSRSKPNSEGSRVTDSKNEEHKMDSSNKTRNRTAEDVYTDNKPNNERKDEESQLENTKPRKRRRKQKSDKDKTVKDKEEKSLQEPMPNLATSQIIEGINMASFNEGLTEENRVPRNPNHESNNLLNSTPDKTEDVSKSFLTGQSSIFPQFNNPMLSNFFANYENIYHSLLSNNMDMNDKRDKQQKRSKRVRKHHRRRKGNKSKNVTEETTHPAISNVFDSVTTEKTVYFKVKMKTNNVDNTPRSEDLKSSTKTIETEEKIIKFSNNVEFCDGCYENVPQDVNENINGHESAKDHDYIYDGYIDDYYPLFTDSAAYNANNKEVYIKNLGDHKYYYATDKENPDFISKRKLEDYGFPDRAPKDYEINKQYNDIEMEGIRSTLLNDFESKVYEEVQFRSPPHLESPDFQTRKVDKSEIYTDQDAGSSQRFVGDKSSSYSEAKTPYYTGAKENGLKSQHKEKWPKSVETVFARSKVANYGAVYSPEDGNTATETSNHAKIDDSYFKDEGTTYILAKPMHHIDAF